MATCADRQGQARLAWSRDGALVEVVVHQDPSNDHLPKLRTAGLEKRDKLSIARVFLAGLGSQIAQRQMRAMLVPQMGELQNPLI